MIDNGSSDACGIGSIQINNSASVTFTCANIGSNTVTLKVTDRAGNVSTCTATVTVAAAAIIVTGQTTVCQGQTVVLNANLGDSYQWFKDGNPISGATNQSYTATSTGSYTVTVTNAGGCSGTSAATAVTISPVPTVTTSPAGTQALCGGTLNITASLGSAYQWSNGAISQTMTATQAGTFTVTVYNEFGCSNTSAPIIISGNNPAPVVTITPSTTSICPGSNATLTGSATGGTGFTYLWSTGSTNTSISVSAAGNYNLTVTNAQGCKTTSADAAVTFKQAPNTPVITPASNLTICSGTPTTLTATVPNSSNSITYNIPLSSLVNMPNNCGTGSYYGSGNSGFNWLDAGTGTVTNVQIKLSIGVECTPGTKSGLLNNVAAVNFGPTTSWCNCAAPTTPQIFTMNFAPTSYVVGGTNTFLFNTNTAGLFPDGSLAGAYAQVTVTYNQPAALLWTPGGMTTNAVTVTPSVTTNYTVTATGTNGCTSSASKTVNVNPMHTVSVAKTDIDCGTPGSITVTATGGTAPFDYSINGGANYQASNVFNNLTAGNYSVVVRSATACVSAPQAVSIVGIPDVTKPVITTCPANQTLNLDASCNATLPDYRSLLTVSDNCTPAGSLVIVQSPAAGTVVNAKGAIIVSFTVTDAKGNSNSCSITVDKLDVTAPVITCPAPIAVNNNTNVCGATVTFAVPTATDNCSGSAFNFFNAGEPNNSGGEDYLQLYNSGTWNDLPDGVGLKAIIEYNIPNAATPAGFNLIGTFGGHTYFVSQNTAMTWTQSRAAALAAGADLASINTLAESQYLAPYGGNTWVGGYQDHSDPQYAEPGNAAQNFGGWKWVDGTKLGAGQITITQIAGLASGSVFPIGVTTNTFRATDESGNSSTCSFNVTVTDNQAPSMPCPANITHTADAGVCTYSFTPATPAATDNCPGVTVTGVRSDALALNAPYPRGVTTIIWTATDTHGLSVSCSQSVTVTDNEKPVIVCAPAQNVNLSANCSAVLGDYRSLLVVSDNCTAANALVITQSPAAGTALNGTGTVTVTFTVTDVAGNFATCSMVVTKKDVTPPVINCPQPIAVNNDPGVCGAVINYGASGLLASSSTGTNAGSLFSVNITTAIATLIGPNGTGVGSNRLTSLAKDPLTGTLYGVIGGSASLGGYLLKINPSTGAGIVVGLMSGSGFNGTPGIGGADALAFSASGTLYSSGWSGGFSGGSFLRIDKNTGAVLQANSTTGSAEYTGLAFSPTTGVLWASRGGNNPGHIHTVNPANGAILTTLNLSDLNARVTDIAFDPSGTLYCSIGGTTNNLATINTTTGAVTVIGSFGAAVQNIAGMTFAGSSSGPVPATDNCSTTVTVVQTAGLPSGALFPVGTTTNTFVATDASGNSTTCNFTVTVTDNEKPTIVSSGNKTQTADAGDCGANVTVAAPTTGDNCGVQSVVNSFNGTANASGHYPVGSTTVNWTVTDIHGNTNTTSQVITVTDNEKPVINNLPVSFSVNALNNNCSNLVTWTRPTATDNCAIASFVSSDGTYDALGFTLLSVGVNTITYTATDVHGNVTTGSFTVTVVDNQVPIITGCPGNITVNAANGLCSAIVNWNPPTASDNCPGVSLSTNHIQGETFPVGTTVVTYTATDHAGLVTTCSFNVTVVDNQLPVIACASNISVSNDAGQCGAGVAITAATATDNCPGVTVAGVRSDALALNAAYPVGTTTITWTATDAHNNTATCTQTVTVTDNENPVISCAAAITHTANAGLCSYSFTPATPVASDNCPGVTVTGVRNDAQALNAAYPVGTTTITWTATDAYGHSVSCTQTVTVTDDENPVLTCPSNITHTADAGVCTYSFTPAAATATDNCPGVTVTGVRSDAQPLNAAYPRGVTTITWTATDAHGHSVSCSRTVTVTDNEKPVIVCAPNQIVNLDANCNGTLPDYRSLLTATDNCTATGSLVITQSPAAGTALNATGSVNVTFTVTDASGNSATCSMVVTKKDVTPPTIVCPAPITVNNALNQCSAVVTYSLPVTSDNCAGGATSGVHVLTSGMQFFDYANNVLENQSSPGLPMTFNPTDGQKMVVFLQSGSSTHFMYQNVTLPASGPIQLGFDLQYNNHNGSFDATNQFIAVEIRNASTNAIIQTLFKTVNGDPLSKPMTHYSYDLSAYAGQTVRLEIVDATINNFYFDVLLDNVTLPGSTLVNGSFETGNYSGWTIFSSNASGGTWGIGSGLGVSLTQTAGLPSGASFPVGTTTNTFVATDLSGNTSTCSFTVTVKDIQKPTITTSGNITRNNDLHDCGANVTVGAPSVGDNCGVQSVVNSYNGTSNASGHYPVGTTTVSWTVTDINGNTTTIIQNITVIDNEKPVITAPAAIAVNNNPGQCRATISSLGTATAGDNCVGGTITNNHPSNVYPVGPQQ
jgi:hypothetical protein